MHGIAAETCSVVTGHEVRALRLDEELAVGANRLKSVMFDDHEFPNQEAKNERCQCRTGDMDEIRFSNQAPELKEAGLADRHEWECTVIITSCRSVCDKRDFELWRAARIAEIGEASGK